MKNFKPTSPKQAFQYAAAVIATAIGENAPLNFQVAGTLYDKLTHRLKAPGK